MSAAALPARCSKWNPNEHRLFSHISMDRTSASPTKKCAPCVSSRLPFAQRATI
ncbi:hypothetical protein JJB74_29020 [Noviherbaspirillum sp. DKR-6]|uniref:Uncharacterized protein n=1 Tax=Noviherbaspirillum pedocola TaxID=2801341 RepID=A0A934SY36_9BURK|nr:hypothetical protein [Noviherbaspirillum pedocola]